MDARRRAFFVRRPAAEIAGAQCGLPLSQKQACWEPLTPYVYLPVSGASFWRQSLWFQAGLVLPQVLQGALYGSFDEPGRWGSFSRTG